MISLAAASFEAPVESEFSSPASTTSGAAFLIREVLLNDI